MLQQIKIFPIRQLCLAAAFLLSYPTLVKGQVERGSEPHHCFVEERSASLGTGIPYSTKWGSPMYHGRAYYNFTKAFCVGPEVSYLSSSTESVFAVDLVAHYIIETPWLGIYPVGGANYTLETEEESIEREEAMGIMYGLGVHKNFGSFTVFLEHTRLESELHDSFFTAGLFYRIQL